MQFILTNDPAILQAYFRIRYERYVEEMQAEPENAERIEKDEYDINNCCHYIIMYDKQVIGGCRLIDRRKARLPVEEFIFPQHSDLPLNCVELSRFTISREYKLNIFQKIELQREFNDYILSIGTQLEFSIFCANIRVSCARWQHLVDPRIEMKIIGNKNFHPGAGKLIPVKFSKKA
ncbi:MAG: GNAT family N-acetyltransferase [Candidatus Moranbacteria bacterium]|nr:GNAT family N-acetyltransferase [Candidatus Moranbacteria bacterium]